MKPQPFYLLNKRAGWQNLSLDSVHLADGGCSIQLAPLPGAVGIFSSASMGPPVRDAPSKAADVFVKARREIFNGPCPLVAPYTLVHGRKLSLARQRYVDPLLFLPRGRD